jgi:predicted alpha/beta superfamily hydrolase
LSWRNYGEDQGTGEHTVVGMLKVLEGVESPQLGNQRDLLVYLPPSYAGGNKRYPVIYMQDGQNLFDEATSFAGEWQVDETLEALSREGLEAIVVGIPNMGDRRIDEYSPFRDRRNGGGQGEQYLAFIVETVKPLIDRDFRTLEGRETTGIMGSSMGGLISLYAFFRYPEIFGFTGVMSPALWFANRAIFPHVEKAPFVPGKIYLDAGTHEFSDSLADRLLLRVRSRLYAANVRQMRDLLAHKGYHPGQDLLYVEEKGAIHHESAWARRLPTALRFLLRG